MPRLGVTFTVPKTFDEIAWFGRGPHENYNDRKDGALFGNYVDRVSEWTSPYVRPQENATRSEVRYVRLGSAEGLEFTAPADAAMSISAWPYSQDDLIETTHDCQLPQRDVLTINIDHQMMGVGGDNSWGQPVHEEYRIPGTQSLSWQWKMKIR